jgi:hypothetical protein
VDKSSYKTIVPDIEFWKGMIPVKPPARSVQTQANTSSSLPEGSFDRRTGWHDRQTAWVGSDQNPCAQAFVYEKYGVESLMLDTQDQLQKYEEKGEEICLYQTDCRR